MKADSLFRDVVLVTMTSDEAQSVISKGALAVSEGKIAWLGRECDLPSGLIAHQEVQGEGRLLLPGLIDCHTHVVYAGDRSHEHEARRQGKTYQQIASEGGGIMSTVRETRNASEAELVKLATNRMTEFRHEGVTSIEIKSGYGLDFENEVKMLRAGQAAAKGLGLRSSLTFLGAHCVPQGTNADAYVELVCREMIPALRNLDLKVSAVDAFCETVGFSREQTAMVLASARHHGFQVKLHADQLSNSEGAGLVADLGGLSADHVEYTSLASCEKMASAGTVAVLLPGAFVTLNETQKPPIDHFRSLGISMAVSTDCNPGTSPFTSIQTMMLLAQEHFGLSVWESLKGVTCHASRALGWQSHRGQLKVGFDADLALFESDSIDQLGSAQAWVDGQRIGSALE
jgi:imidazolonepropionase